MCLLSKNQIRACADVKKSLKCFSIALLMYQKLFLMPAWKLLSISVCPLSLVLLSSTTGQSWSVLGASLQTQTDRDGVPSQPPLLEAEQRQLPQPFPVPGMLQPLHHRCSPGLAPLQALPVPPVLSSPSPASCKCGLVTPRLEGKRQPCSLRGQKPPFAPSLPSLASL